LLTPVTRPSNLDWAWPNKAYSKIAVAMDILRPIDVVIEFNFSGLGRQCPNGLTMQSISLLFLKKGNMPAKIFKGSNNRFSNRSSKPFAWRHAD